MAYLSRIIKDGKVGYVDSYGMMIIEPKYDDGVESFGSNTVNKILYAIVSLQQKYGIINEEGLILVPIVYDVIKYRSDNLFDVRSDNRWGVIDNTGKAIVSIKYNKQIPLSFDNVLVTDSITGRKGILKKDGSEKIPSIYEHLMPKRNFYFFGYGGIENANKGYNFYSDTAYAKWGVLSKEGTQIIDAKYDCLIEKDGYIQAGREGHYLKQGSFFANYEESYYDGVFDLYNYDGQLLIGGFNWFYKDENFDNILVFRFGGKWVQNYERYDDEGNNIKYYSYDFDDTGARWLVTNNELRSLIPNNDGTFTTFPQGSIFTIVKEYRYGEPVYYWTFPDEYSLIEPRIYPGLIEYMDGSEKKDIEF